MWKNKDSESEGFCLRVWVMSLYLQGIKISAKLFSIKHGLEVLQTAVDAVQIVHQLHPDKTDTKDHALPELHFPHYVR